MMRYYEEEDMDGDDFDEDYGLDDDDYGDYDEEEKIKSAGHGMGTRSKRSGQTKQSRRSYRSGRSGLSFKSAQTGTKSVDRGSKSNFTTN